MSMKSFDLRRFCEDHNIPYYTTGFKQCSHGWVQLDCPFPSCTGGEGPHLGWHEESGVFNCWRCGRHNAVETVAALGGLTFAEARDVLKEYGWIRSAPVARRQSERVTPAECKLPAGTGPLKRLHRRYLKRRGFHPMRVAQQWGLLATGSTGSYKYRIVAPIFYGDQLVSFQARDVTGRSQLRYKACRKEDEVRPHKHCLYGSWLVPGDTVIIVEGITDAWRLGPGAVATFGLSYTTEQVAELVKYQRRYILFDMEPAAQVQARKLSRMLGQFDGVTEIVVLESVKDPAELTDKQAQTVRRMLLGL